MSALRAYHAAAPARFAFLSGVVVIFATAIVTTIAAPRVMQPPSRVQNRILVIHRRPHHGLLPPR
ncbi:MAG TPA: hypothetical protein VGT03_07945 [Candidatus Acidoferrales bacterium]|nr:hypothetical protein [Candidatus Acidoferrales bacterium]